MSPTDQEGLRAVDETSNATTVVSLSRSTAALAVLAFAAIGFFGGRLSVAEPIPDEDIELAAEALPIVATAPTDFPADPRGKDGVVATGDTLLAPALSFPSRADAELQRGQRQAVELNEMLCKQAGQNCEAAAMARRHYEETYGPM